MQMQHVVIRPGAQVTGPTDTLGQVAYVVVDETTRQLGDLVIRRPDGSSWLVPAREIAETTPDLVRVRTDWAELEPVAEPFAVEDFHRLADHRAVPSPAPVGEVRECDRAAVELREEQLHVRKVQRESGAVELRKEVVSEQQTLEVPVYREEIEIEHRPVERTPTDMPIGDDRSVSVVVREESVTVTKEPVVTEIVRVGRRSMQRTEHIDDTIRREVADVRADADVRIEPPSSDRSS